MPTKFPSAVRRYCKAKKHSKGTSDEYKATVRKWISWGQDIRLEQLSRSVIRDFLDWVYDHAVEQGGENPERTSNKARDHIRAVAAWVARSAAANGPAMRSLSGLAWHMNTSYFSAASFSGGLQVSGSMSASRQLS